MFLFSRLNIPNVPGEEPFPDNVLFPYGTFCFVVNLYTRYDGRLDKFFERSPGEKGFVSMEREFVGEYHDSLSYSLSGNYGEVND